MFYIKIIRFVYGKYGFLGLSDFIIKSLAIRIKNFLNSILYFFKCTYSQDVIDIDKTNKLFDYDQDKKIEENTDLKNLFNNFQILGVNIDKFFHIENKELWIEKNINFSNKKYCRNIYRKSFNDSNSISNIKFVKWNYDPKNSYYWSYKKNSLFININFNKKKDVKFPWEISRLQHLNVSALKIKKQKNKNKNKTSFAILKNHIFDFIVSNPPGFGVNWKSPMEVAIRGANLCVIADILESEYILEIEEKRILLNSIQDHIYFVKNNLEWSYLNTSNHYLANIVGLIIMSYFLPRSDLNQKILAFACNQLLNEIDNQFYEDGGNKEGSTAYHIFSNEMILIGLHFYSKIENYEKNLNYVSLFSFFNKFSSITKYSKKVDKKYEKKIFRKLKKINYFSSKCIRNNETLLQVGDNDSGCFFPFDYVNFFGEKKYLHKNLSIENNSNLFFSLINKKHLQITKNKITKYLFSKHKFKNFEKMFNDLPKANKNNFFIKFNKNINIDEIEQDIFDKFGLYCFTSKDISLFIICKKKINFFNSGHNHDDNLSIDLVINKEAIITDPGSFCYTDDLKLRFLYRGYNAHFVPRTSGMLNQKIIKNPFYFFESYDGKCEYINKNIFLGSLKMQDIIIYRYLEIKNEGLLIKDFCVNDTLINYSSLEHNLKISSSYGVLSKINMINKNKLRF